MKSLSDINNFHSLKSIPRNRRSAKPALPTTAILNLYMARNERDRLVKERIRLFKRKNQLEIRLKEIEGEMDESLKNSQKMAKEMRGKPLKDPEAEGKGKGKGKLSSIILGY